MMTEASATKQCPYCKETVHVDAVKCKHCGAAIDLQIMAFKQKGKLTVVGWIGSTLGVLMLWLAFTQKADSPEAPLAVGAAGAAFLLVSFLQCRR